MKNLVNEKRQLSFQTSFMNVPHNTIPPRLVISLLHIKKYRYRLILASKALPHKSIYSDKMIQSWFLSPKATLYLTKYFIILHVLNQSTVDHLLQNFTQATGKWYRPIIPWVTVLFPRFGYGNDRCHPPVIMEKACIPCQVEDFKHIRQRCHWNCLNHHIAHFILPWWIVLLWLLDVIPLL